MDGLIHTKQLLNLLCIVYIYIYFIYVKASLYDEIMKTTDQTVASLKGMAMYVV